MANNKDFEKDFKLPDTKALSEAYTEYLDSVTFGGKPIGEEKKKPEAVSMAKVDETEKSSTVHDEIVEKIVRKNKALSHSIWTDEPVLKPKKSVWLNTDDDNEEALKKVEKKAEKVENSQSVQKAQEKNAEEKVSDNEVIIPFSKEKNHINGTKKEISVAVSADGTVKKLPNKKNFVLKIPDSYYREYDATAQNKGPVIAGKRVEIIDKRSPEKKPENAHKPSRVETTINVRVPVQKEEKPNKKNFVLKIPDSYYREYDATAQNKGPVIAGKRVEIIDKRSPEKKPENAHKPSRVETTINVRVPVQKEEKPVRKAEKKAEPKSEPKPDPVEKEESDAKAEEAYRKGIEKAKKRREEREKAKKNNIHELEFNVINSVVCLLIVFGVFAALLVMKRESGFIQSENRNLATFPKFSLSSYFDGDFTSGITEYFTDTVPNREKLKSFCSDFTNMLGIKLNDTVITGDFKTVEKEELDQDKIAKTTTVTAFTGSRTTTTADTKATDTSTTTKKSTESEKVVDVPDNLDDGQWEGDVIVSGKGENVRAMGAYYGTFENGDKYANTINKWKADLGDSVNVYNMSIPTSAAYYMPNNLKDAVSDQKDNIDNIAAGLNGIINTDVYDSLAEHTKEYIYSRTDHHWQPLGAYYAAQVFADQSGIDFPDIDTYDKWEIDGFVGTMYAYSNYNSELKKYPDKFIYYKPDNNDDLTVKYYDTEFKNPVESTLFFDYAEGVNCYSAILNVDQEIAEIDTGVDNGRVLVVFKDSFGNALIPFFTHGFSKIYVCDFRYFDINAIDFCKEVGCTDLLFAISLTSCSTPSKVDCLNNIRIQ